MPRKKQPRTVRGVTYDQRQLIRHALGLTYGSTGYRNRYLAAGDSLIAQWRHLVKIGMAVEGDATGAGVWFAVTTKGFEAVRKKFERMDREEAAAMALLDLTAAQRAEVAARTQHAPEPQRTESCHG